MPLRLAPKNSLAVSAFCSSYSGFLPKTLYSGFSPKSLAICALHSFYTGFLLKSLAVPAFIILYFGFSPKSLAFSPLHSSYNGFLPKSRAVPAFFTLYSGFSPKSLAISAFLSCYVRWIPAQMTGSSCLLYSILCRRGRSGCPKYSALIYMISASYWKLKKEHSMN